MSLTPAARAVARAGERAAGGRRERLLVLTGAMAAATAVAVYLVGHRDLVLAPGRALLAELAGGGWAPDTGPLLSFVPLLLPPLVLLLALALGFWPWSRLYHPSPTLRLLATAIMVSAALVLLQIGLAEAGLLATGPLAVSAAALAALLLVADRGRRWVAGAMTPGPLAERPGEQGRLAAAARLSGRGLLARAAARRGLAAPSALGLALGGLAAATWLALTTIAALVPPWGWDALAYHLADLFWFAQSGTLAPFPHPEHQFHFPKVAELHSLWFYLLAGAGDQAWRVSGIAQLPLALTGALAVRAAAELLGLRSALPWLVPAMMLLPLALIQPLAGYTDLASTAFLLAGFTFLIAALRRRHAADWALAALACGLALGSKLSFVYLCLPLLVLLAARPARLRPRRLLLRLALCALLFTAGCGYWLLPQLLRTGNPFHPLAVQVGGQTLLAGPVAVEAADSNRQRYTTSLAGWLAYPLRERFMGAPGYSPDNGFGPQFAAAYLVLPLALGLALLRRRRLLVRALLAAPAMALAWLMLSPWEHPRYILAVCGFALLGLASLEEAAASGRAVSAGGRALIRAALAASLVFAAPAGLLAAAPELPRIAAAWKRGDWQPRDVYTLRYGYAGEAFNWLSEHGGAGTTVSFTRATFIAPLFGWHGRNRVVYATSHAERRVAGAPFAGSGRSWRRFLERQRVDWVVVWRDWWAPAAPPTAQERWIAAARDGFDEIASFGDRVEVLAPAPPAVTATELDAISELAAAPRWSLEYASGAEASLSADPAGGLRVDYRFLGPGPDYLDLRFELGESGWPADGRLAFGLEAPGGSPLLWIYLKEAEARRSCRFRIAPRPPTHASEQLQLPLDRPESRAHGFSTRQVATVHLVLDDGGAAAPSTGSFRLFDFRLEPADPGRRAKEDDS